MQWRNLACPSVGPGPSSLVGIEQEEDVATPESSRPPSRAAVESIGDSEEEEAEEEEDVALPVSKKVKKSEAPLVARVGKKKGKGTGVAQFLLAYADMQEQSQLRQMEHESRMQEEAMKFQAKMEQDRLKFEAEMSARLQQQSSQFQMTLMQQSQLFHAELFKKCLGRKTKRTNNETFAILSVPDHFIIMSLLYDHIIIDIIAMLLIMVYTLIIGVHFYCLYKH